MPILKYSPSEIMLFLHLNGIKVKFEESEDEMVDSSIIIDETLHIQCCENGEYCLVQEIGETFKFFGSRTNPMDLLKDINSI